MVNAAQLLVRSVLIAAQQAEMVLQLARVGGDGKTPREPVLGYLPPTLLVGIELHKPRSLLTDARDVMHMDRWYACNSLGPDVHLSF